MRLLSASTPRGRHSAIPDALEAISDRIGELEAKLAASPIYRELTILCKARDDLRKLPDSGTGSAKDVAKAPNVGPKTDNDP